MLSTIDTSCPPRMSRHFTFPGDDIRNGNCVYFIGYPPQVETSAHYIWRNNLKIYKASKPQSEKIEGTLMCTLGFIIGDIFSIALYNDLVYSGKEDQSPW